MDVQYFLRRRTQFIRRFYDEAAGPFVERRRMIEAEEDPYKPPYSEDGEPAFMEEWQEAQSALEVLGRTCVSMLSASLKLYLETWRRELGIDCTEFKSTFRNKGVLRGYRECFERRLQLKWDECPADFDILEQVILARNRDQHPEHIARLAVI